MASTNVPARDRHTVFQEVASKLAKLEGFKQRKVGIRVKVDRLLELTDTAESFKLVFDLVFEWKDPTLKNKTSTVVLVSGDSLTGILEEPKEPGKYLHLDVGGHRFEIPLDKVTSLKTEDFPKCVAWTPEGRYIFGNQVGERIEMANSMELLDGKTGKIRWFQKMVCKFHAQMDLEKFPFDEHHLRVSIIGTTPKADLTFEYIKNDDGSSANRLQCKHSVDHTWQVKRSPTDDGKGTKDLLVIDEVKGREPHTRASIFITVQRERQHYLLNYILVVFLLTNISFASYAIPLTDFADRLGAQATFLLTAISFKLLVASKIPVKNYFTGLETYVACSFLITSLPAAVQFFILRFFCTHKDRERLSLYAKNLEGHGHLVKDGYHCSEEVVQREFYMLYFLFVAWWSHSVAFVCYGWSPAPWLSNVCGPLLNSESSSESPPAKKEPSYGDDAPPSSSSSASSSSDEQPLLL